MIALVRDLRDRMGVDCGEPCEDHPRDEYVLNIVYAEQPTDPVAPYAADDCAIGDCEFSRVREGYRFELSCDAAEPEPTITDVLRAEALLPEIKPSAIVLSFIADDVRRTEMKRLWGAEKPYFEWVNGELALRNSPVPLPPNPADTLSVWQRLFGRSVLVDTLLRHQGWQYEWAIDHVRVLSEAEGERQLCPLMRRLATLGLPTLVVAEYDPYLWMDDDYAPAVRRVTGLVLTCAEQAGLATLDLFEPIDAAVRSKGLRIIYREAHPSPAGTEITAERIARELKVQAPLAR